ncbi:MAG: hypothetical protein K6A43_11700 [Treponema sp.]|nr:hypothetical protein [Treponema sp.]
MERRFQKIKIFLAAAVFFIGGILAGFGGVLYAQVPSVIEHIRFPLWAELDAYPGLKDAYDPDSGVYDFPISRIRETGPFLMEGMVYGWDFVYVPYDKTREVQEYFELSEIQPLSEGEGDIITYSSPWIEDNRLNCWCDFTRSEYQIQNYYLWATIQNPTIQGRGYGSLELGFDGIRQAAEDAAKNAVRNYYRSVIKNKPKEIRGKLLLRKIPTLGIDAGRYTINLDFFMECGRILEYKQF